MIDTFKCPNCGAPLTYHGPAPIIECQFCGSSVVVPETLRGQSAANPQLAGVLASLQAGNKIEAIKKYRELTNVSLSEAKAAVEQLQAGQPVTSPDRSTINLNETLGQADQLAGIITSLRAGNKIEAIKKYRALTNVGLAEAKAAVEQLQAGQIVIINGQPVQASGLPASAPASSNRACAGIGLAVVSVAVLVLMLSVGLPVYFAFQNTDLTTATATPTVTPTPSPTPFAQLVQSFGQKGDGPGYFTDARTIGVDKQGRIFVGDYSPGRIQAFSADGNFLWQQLMPAENDYVNGLAADLQGNLYALVGRKINVYQTDTGKLINQWTPNPDQVGRYEAIAVTPKGEVVAVHSRELAKFSAQGKLLMQVGGVKEGFFKQVGVKDFAAEVTGLAIDGTGTMYISTSANFVLKLDENGRLIDRIEGPTDEDRPYSLAVDGPGRLAWGYAYHPVLTTNTGKVLGNFKSGFLSDLEFNLRGQLVGISRNPQQVEVYTFGR